MGRGFLKRHLIFIYLYIVVTLYIFKKLKLIRKTPIEAITCDGSSRWDPCHPLRKSTMLDPKDGILSAHGGD